MQIKIDTLGLYDNECDILQLVCLDKIGKKYIQNLNNMVNDVKILPQKLKNKSVISLEKSLAMLIISEVTKQYNTMIKTPNGSLFEINNNNESILIKLTNTIVNDINVNIIQDTFKLKFNVFKHVNLKYVDINYTHFSILKQFIKELNFNALKKLLISINKMHNVWDYVGYFTCEFSHETVIKFMPFINELELHEYRFSIALCDSIYILLRSIVKSLLPIITYLDKSTKNFDKTNHHQSLLNVINDSVVVLATNYFPISNMIYKTCSGVNTHSINILLQFVKNIVNDIGNMYGKFCLQWKPTSSQNVKTSFRNILIPILNDFIHDSLGKIINCIKMAMQYMISHKILNDNYNDNINDICQTVNDYLLHTNNNNININSMQMIQYILNKSIFNLTDNTINYGLQNIINNLYKKNNTFIMDETLCKSLRFIPKMNDVLTFWDDVGFHCRQIFPYILPMSLIIFLTNCNSMLME